MISMRGLFKNHWWVVLGSTLALIVGNGPIQAYSAGIFIKPITAEFGWTRATLSGITAISLIFAVVSMPVIGRLLDRFGTRRVMLPLIALYALGIASFSQTTASPLSFLIISCLCAIPAAGQGPIPYVKAISSVFDRQRGLALGIAMAGIGVGAVIVPHVAQALVTSHGWRIAYVGVACLMFVVAFPSVLLFVSDSNARKERGTRETGGAEAIAGLSVRDTLTGSGAKHFWLFAAVIFLVATATNGALFHFVPLLTDRGFSIGVAVSIFGAIGISTVIGRVLSGYLADRFFAPYIAAGFFLLPCLGFYTLASGSGSSGPIIGGILIGLATGSEIDMMGFLGSRYFGLRNFGEIYAYLFVALTAGVGVGPFLMALSFDKTQSYNTALFGGGVLLLAASVLVSRLGPYRYAVERAVLGKSTEPLPVLARKTI